MFGQRVHENMGARQGGSRKRSKGATPISVKLFLPRREELKKDEHRMGKDEETELKKLNYYRCMQIN